MAVLHSLPLAKPKRTGVLTAPLRVLQRLRVGIKWHKHSRRYQKGLPSSPSALTLNPLRLTSLGLEERA